MNVDDKVKALATTDESKLSIAKAKYRLRYFFDAGSSSCLGADNDEARQKFDYSINMKELPLQENRWRRAAYISAWFNTSIDWNYPPDPSPWDQNEQLSFNAEAQKLLMLLRTELGPDFELVDESGTAASN